MPYSYEASKFRMGHGEIAPVLYQLHDTRNCIIIIIFKKMPQPHSESLVSVSESPPTPSSEARRLLVLGICRFVFLVLIFWPTAVNNVQTQFPTERRLVWITHTQQ